MENLWWPLGTSLGQPSQESHVHDGGSITFLVNGTLLRPLTRPKDGPRAFRAGWACIELTQSAPVRVPLLQPSENRAIRRASIFLPCFLRVTLWGPQSHRNVSYTRPGPSPAATRPRLPPLALTVPRTRLLRALGIGKGHVGGMSSRGQKAWSSTRVGC